MNCQTMLIKIMKEKDNALFRAWIDADKGASLYPEYFTEKDMEYLEGLRDEVAQDTVITWLGCKEKYGKGFTLPACPFCILFSNNKYFPSIVDCRSCEYAANHGKCCDSGTDTVSILIEQLGEV